MHVLTVCYGHPADPAAFDSYYASTHRPLAEKIPGLASFTVRHCDSLDGSQPPYYLLAELSFASRLRCARRRRQWALGLACAYRRAMPRQVGEPAGASSHPCSSAPVGRVVGASCRPSEAEGLSVAHYP